VGAFFCRYGCDFCETASIGQNDGNTGNTSLVITNESSGVVFEVKNETSIPIAKDGKVELKMGWWNPTALENITLNATADCDDDIDEMGELNNTKIETRNTTGDCKVGDMLPYTCFGYGGQHPMDTEIKSACNRSLIYTTGDYKYRSAYKVGPINYNVNFSIGTDMNRITNAVEDIPDGAKIKTARLYLYYTWYPLDIYNWKYPSEYWDMTFVKGACNPAAAHIPEAANYSDFKGYSSSYTYNMYGTITYDVTDLVDGNGSYCAYMNNNEPGYTSWGYPTGTSFSGMALLIVYEHESVPHIEYYIDDGCDRLASIYKEEFKWDYYLAPEDATTNATFPCIDNPPEEIVNAKLFTATIDANGAYETLYFNNGSWTGV
jgi:hypothetical protein